MYNKNEKSVKTINVTEICIKIVYFLFMEMNHLFCYNLTKLDISFTWLFVYNFHISRFFISSCQKEKHTKKPSRKKLLLNECTTKELRVKEKIFLSFFFLLVKKKRIRENFVLLIFTVCAFVINLSVPFKSLNA